MATGTRRWVSLRGLFVILLVTGLVGTMCVTVTPGWAQDDESGEEQEEEGAEAQPAAPTQQLFITGSDTSVVPTIVLRAYGLTREGRPLALSDQPLVVRHAGEPVEEVQVSGTAEVGTFTVFLVDVTSGTESQIPAIQQAIEQYASSAYMKEQVDSLTIYRVGPEEASQELEPTIFYNSVRNFFSMPFEPQEGPTALIDSLVTLLNSMEEISPNPDLVPAIVVFSDGTDAVSTQFQPEDVGRQAAESAIPVHTVWLENEELTVGREAGLNYLATVAADSYGLAARLDQPDTVTAIFERISAFRDQQLIRYTAPELTGGAATVEVSLLNDPTVQAQTEVTINASAPSVTLNVPPDSRTLQLPTLDQPVRLAFSGDVAWLDGTERQLEAARLLINGQTVQEVPVNSLQRFEAEIENLVYGDNSVQLEVIDDQGLRAASPAIVLSVVEGEQQIPDVLQAGSGLLTSALPLCAGATVLLALFGLGGLWAFRSGRLDRFRSRRARRDAAGEEGASATQVAPVAPPTAEPAAAAADAQAFLEILATETQMPSHLPIRNEETRLGRSPSLADVAFEQDITVSRLHATILWDGHSYRLYDDDSTSGTWVNDQEVPDYGIQLFDGDDIFLGKVHLRFRQR